MIIFPVDPQDGDTFLYVTTQEEFVCKRNGTETPQWACLGTFKDSTFAYQGALEILRPAPTNAETGYIYSVIDGGVADASFGSLAGLDIEQWSLVIFTGDDWVLVSSAATGPWIRTQNGQIQPVVGTDDLNMLQGDYVIESLPILGS